MLAVICGVAGLLVGAVAAWAYSTKHAQSLRDGGRVDDLRHRSQDRSREYDFVDLLASKDLHREGDVVRVLLGGRLKRERAKALGLLGG